MESATIQPGFDSIAQAVCLRLAKNQRSRRNLPGDGRLRIDRQLPFLCVHRSPPGEDDLGTRQLVTTEAAYLFASGDEQYLAGIEALCRQIQEAMHEHFGAFLLIEVWAQEKLAAPGSPLLKPAFRISSPDLEIVPSLVEALESGLSAVRVHGNSAEVAVRECREIHPPGLPPLSLGPDCAAGTVRMGLGVRPIYRDAQTGRLYPLILESMRSQVSTALRQGIAKFAPVDSTSEPRHYHSFGPSCFVKSARVVDRQLAEVSESFDFLLQVTPINSDEAWEAFQANDFRSEPVLHYRPLPYHPNLLKRRLFDIEIDRIEDPTLAHLCREKQDELDIQLTALKHLDSPKFLHSSLIQYGDPDEDLLALAGEILARHPDNVPAASGEECLNADEVVRRAREEIGKYRRKSSEFPAKVEVCDHISSGIMVSQDRLLVSKNLQLSSGRVGPLLHHEIGTHLLTYYNGRQQPLRQLYAGFAGYEELQEGLALLAEHLTGGLTVNRLRTLAGRVMAAKSRIAGAAFAETFSRLHEDFRFTPRLAFVTTLRAYRGGGLTKDIIYLRGLQNLLLYLANGHDVEPLYVGKIGLQHMPYIQEMRRRGIIHPPALLPRFWSDPSIGRRIDACRKCSVLELLESEK